MGRAAQPGGLPARPGVLGTTVVAGDFGDEGGVGAPTEVALIVPIRTAALAAACCRSSLFPAAMCLR